MTEPPLGRPVQIAYLVEDVRVAAADWAARLGAGPFFWRRHAPLAGAWHRGEPAGFDHSSAYGQWGSVMVELVQVHAAGPPDMAGRLLQPPGLHHVAMFTADLGREQARLEALGWPELLRARSAHGLTFVFHDARRDLGHLIELYEPDPRVVALYDTVAAAARDWDGTDPVRPL